MSKKRGNGEGSIHRHKDGGWCAQYTVYTAEGRKRKTLYGKTRAEVGGKLAKAVSDREGGFAVDVGNLTVGKYMDRWLKDSVKDTVRPRTLERYEQIFRLHISPTFGWIETQGSHPRPRSESLSR
ncbi:MAG TPA: N-terminal phage integrase SAM-like domain-containing protein [Rubrobacteraceae bacterium]|nr:N-terminal phage integrase SAM-like domain-containing protein [Rubrobacteraceae bacterium]